MRVILSCGGTGGHITPALAIADLIKKGFSGAQILFVGASGGMEEEIVSRAGYEIRTLSVRGLSRRAGIKNILTLQKMLAARSEAKGLLAAFAPDIVIGTGGYACYPSLSAAIGMGIPTAVHESNAVPGLAVKRLARGVGRVWLNFPQAGDRLPKGAQTLVVGNPLPKGYHLPRPAPLPAGCRHMLLSFGGSLGASEVNRAVLALMRANTDPTLYHLHATGKREFERCYAEFCQSGLQKRGNLRLAPYLSDMPQQMAAADLVICRAGAMSISELAALGKAAILIPSPNVAGDHQYKNAMALASEGAAICVCENEMKDGALFVQAMRLLRDTQSRNALQNAIRRFHNPHANACILRDILTLTQCKK